jgi:hypothetical protein
LALFSSTASAEWKEGQRSAAPITIYTEFDQTYSGQSFESLKSELDAIMGPIGLQFEWRDLKSARGNEVSVELVVVSFRGKCNMQESMPRHVTSGALGWTHMSDGDVLPFSDVDCDRVRGLIAPATQGITQSERERVFGRALGRVLAHEMYHIFANTTRHASVGVAKAFYTAGELVSDNFRFEEKETRTLRQGKLRNLFLERSQPTTAADGGGQ